MVKIFDGKKVSEEIIDSLEFEINAKGLNPKLAIIFCGENEGSKIYTEIKKKKSLAIGIKAEIHKFPEDVKEDVVINKIKKLNTEVDGIIVQLPLPQILDTKKIISAIDNDKDVDGLTFGNLGKIQCKEEDFASATPKGVIRLLEVYGVDVKGKNVVIINHSNIVGKPLAMMLINRGATVTICHEFTQNLKEHCLNADILVSGIGKAGFITGEMIKQGVMLIDIGISKVNGGIFGDIDFESIKDKASYITPVPGGVGPMTVAMLLENVVNRASKNL